MGVEHCLPVALLHRFLNVIDACGGLADEPFDHEQQRSNDDEPDDQHGDAGRNGGRQEALQHAMGGNEHNREH